MAKKWHKTHTKSVLDIEALDVLMTPEGKVLTVDNMSIFYSTGEVRIECVEGDVLNLRETDQVTVLVEVEREKSRREA